MSDTWKAIIQTTSAKIYGLAIGLVFLSLTARWLGPEGRGLYAATFTWVNTFAVIFFFSAGQVSIREAARTEGVGWLPEALGALIFWLIVNSAVACLVAWALYVYSDGAIFGEIEPTLLAFGFLLLPFLIWERYGTALLTAAERLDVFNRYQVMGKSLSLIVLMLLMVLMGYGVYSVVGATLIGQIVIALGGIVMLWRMSGRPNLLNKTSNLKYITGGLSLHLNAIGAFLFMSSDILMLNYYRGVEETGYYQLGAQIVAVVMVLPQATSLVMVGKVSSLGPDRAWLVQRKLMTKVIGLAILGAVVAALTAKWWLIWFAGENFAPTIGLLPWQLLSVVGMSFSILMYAQWIGRGYFKLASTLTFVVGLGNIIANSYLIPLYGMYGAIWASIGVYSISILANGIMILHCNKMAKVAA